MESIIIESVCRICKKYRTDNNWIFWKNLTKLEKSKTILFLINKAKKVIPSSCRIVYSFYTQMSIIGNLNENGDYLCKHMDKEDLVSALLYVGDPSNGGKPKYYAGLTSKSFGHLAKETLYEHGQLTIGWFGKILHCGESWSVWLYKFQPKKTMEHFLRYGNKYYKQFEGNKFPAGPFFSC